MTRHTPGRRAGFTLVELLVAMAVIVVLATITIAVVPSAIEQDRTTDAAATIRQHLMIAKARATRENNGRGIRFILDGGSADPVRISAGAPLAPGGFLSTEMQYIEAAPTLVPNPLGLTRPTVTTPTLQVGDPFVTFDVKNKQYKMWNVMKGSEVYQVMRNDLGARWYPKLYCPELGPDAFGRTQRFEITDMQPPDATAPADQYVWDLSLDYDPYTLLGAGDTQVSYRFAIEPRSRPLLGEPNIPLPKNVCVDLNAGVSSPGARQNGAGLPIDFEVMFAPNGQVIDPYSSGMIYLWVRDYTKLPDMRPATVTPAFTYKGQDQFKQGGEQQLVAIKAKTGALGVFPVLWPQADGTYPAVAAGQPPTTPYSLAAKDANAP